MWSIALIKNEVKITKKIAKEIYKKTTHKFEDEVYNDIFYSLDEVMSDSKLQFNPDHNEGMDYLASEAIVIDLLKKHKVSGDICFGSLEGDNQGEFWGYRFDGKGGMKHLEGKVVFEVEK
jgi:hypothetical protein